MGQIVQGERYEIKLDQDETPFKVESAGESGLFLYRGFAGYPNSAINVAFLDTAFESKWAGFISVERNYVESKAVYYDTSLYILLRYQDFSRTDMQIIAVDKATGKYIIHPFKNFIPLQITQFKVTQKAALIGGYFNRVPVVIYYSFESRSSKIAPGLFNEAGELIQIRTYDDGAFDVVVSANNFMRQQTIIIRNYDPQGMLVKNIALHPDEKKNLIFGRSLKTGNEMQVVAGVYGNRKSEFSKGIFVASIDPVGDDLVRYYSYPDLENFFKFMRARRELRVKERIARRKIKGRKLRFNYRFIVHELVPYKDQYIVLGEAFYPKYTYPDGGGGRGTLFGPTFYNYPRAVNGRIFDGYYYTHAVVIGFDKEGKLLWDNSFEINDVRTFELEQFVKLDVHEDHITLLYFFDHNIRSKIINDNQVIEGKSVEPIKLNSNVEAVRRGGTESAKLEYWYPHHFFASGIQNVSYVANGLRKTRRVFFINKVSNR